MICTGSVPRRETVALNALKLRHQRRQGTKEVGSEKGFTEILFRTCENNEAYLVPCFKTKSPI